jgi:hypothetical protein
VIPIELRDKFPLDKATIRPPSKPCTVSIAGIGIRDLVPTLNLFPIKKMFCKFDISGDTKGTIVTNPHPVIGGSCNIFEILSLPVEVPLKLDYAPVLTVFFYDNLMGIFGTRLVGICNIDLRSYVERIFKVTNAFSTGQ